MKNQTIWLIALALLLPACGLVDTPKVEDPALLSPQFSHDGFTSNCASCHEGDRPAAEGTIAHGGGADCASCHKPGATWAESTSMAFSHTPTPKSCVTCHESKRPDPTHGGGGDCVSCHVPGNTWAGTPGSSLTTFSHVPVPTSCVACHEADRPPAIAGVAHGGGADCAACHIAGTVWNGQSAVTQAHNPIPTSCVTCHSADRPAVVNGVTHGGGSDCVSCHQPAVSWSASKKTYAHSPIPTNCQTCHERRRPATTTYPRSAAAVTGHYTAKDCTTCHQPPASGKLPFDFFHSNASNQNINFCLPCHTRDGQGEHSNRPEYFVGDGLCYNCHNKKRKSWDR